MSCACPVLHFLSLLSAFELHSGPSLHDLFSETCQSSSVFLISAIVRATQIYGVGPGLDLDACQSSHVLRFLTFFGLCWKFIFPNFSSSRW